MRRAVWNTTAAASAVLAVAALLLWAGSYRRFYHVAWESYEPATRDWREFNLHVKEGRLTTWIARRKVTRGVIVAIPPAGLQWTDHAAVAYLPVWDGWLFRWQRGRGPGAFGTTGFVEMGVNVLVLAALAAVPVIVWRVRQRRRHLQEQAGQCRRCGYDLRASPRRCPECGAVPA